MSGGHFNYAYRHIATLAIDIEYLHMPEREKFKKLLELVAKACHDIEWVDSGDYGYGDEIPAIEECFKFCKEN